MKGLARSFGFDFPSGPARLLLLLLLLIGAWYTQSSPITINYASSNGYEPSETSTPRAIIPVSQSDDCDFYILAKIGTTGDYYRMSLDTAAKSSLVDASTCVNAKKYADVHCFDSKQSKTFSVCGDSCRSPYISMQHRSCLRMGLDDFTFANSTLPTAKGFAFCLADWFYNSFDHCDGILGLQSADTYVPQSDVTYLFGSNLFALDLHADNNTPSYFHIGGWDPSYNVFWSESISVRSQYQSFMTYHLSICGVDLFEGTSSFMLTNILSRYPQVLFPQFLLDMIMRWIPAPCIYKEFQLQCTFKTASEDAAIVLPTLVFQLSENGNHLQLPLDALIEKKTFDSTRNQTVVLFYLAYYPQQVPTIYLGLPGIRNFYSVYDNRMGRVGLAQHRSYVPRNITDGCMAPAVCETDQTYDPLTNTCKDINCNVYYLQELDKETKNCKLKTSSVIGLLIVFVLLSLAELVITRLYSGMVSKILKIFPTNNSTTLLPHPRRD
eukprot:TRINITY_DN10968_c0_g1_i1.p1 TRINITY_DN10968_c0_g1~~TRINITY_DN10968_c0_g1_i1.p1  ORF type:complete len:521 (-),score=46.31 TRINITY_DN10968_c0_g1_i1:27-1511(-)